MWLLGRLPRACIRVTRNVFAMRLLRTAVSSRQNSTSSVVWPRPEFHFFQPKFHFFISPKTMPKTAQISPKSRSPTLRQV